MMLRKAATSLCATLTSALTLMICSMPAYAIGDLVDVQVIDRSTGETLTPVLHKGEWWIAGRPGARYAVVLANRYGARTLNVLSVDGVNAISGETAAWNQRGYVLDAYGRTQVAGWRKNMGQVNAFEFTTLRNSYATRTGRPTNVGVIGVAIFNERPEPIAQAQVGRESRAESRPKSRADSRAGAPSLLRAPADAAEPLRAEAEADVNAPASPRANDAMKSEATRSGIIAPQQRERIGTGYGAVENSAIVNVRFERMQSAPNEIVTIHYDSRENLIALGVLPSPPLPPVAVNPAVNPFPNGGGFVPEPPRRW